MRIVRPALISTCFLLALLAGVAPAPAQEQEQRLPVNGRVVRRSEPWRSRILEADRLLRMGSYSRAASALKEADSLGAPPAQTRRRWIELRTSTEEHEEVVRLCREGLAERSGQPRLLRALARSLMALDRDDEAADAMNALFAASPNRVSSVADAVLMWRDADKPARALALCDSLREVRGDDRVFMRQRAACLLDLGRIDEGMAEFSRELRLNPLNLPMVREELSELIVAPEQIAAAADALADASGDPAPPLRLLRADLLLRLGREGDALKAVEPLFDDPGGATELLTTATSLARELELQDDPGQQRATSGWLVRVYSSLVEDDRIPRNQQARVADLLAGVCEDAMKLGYLDDDPERAAAKLLAALDLVRDRSPGSTRLYSAQITLAVHTRDVLRRPREAVAQLERLLVDLDLPVEGISLARLALGECHLASGDTTRARVVLTRLGRTPQFAEAAGHAHYLLGRLDFAQGAWQTAQDRLSAVALDNPQADYANEALDLGLLVAEELSNPVGGPHRLEAYAPCVYWELTRRPVYLQEALEDFVASSSTDGSGGDYLLDRARLELARIHAESGWTEKATAACADVALGHPDGHHAAMALLLQGEILTAAGHTREGRDAWERLIVQYPEAMEAEDARLKLRSLP